MVLVLLQDHVVVGAQRDPILTCKVTQEHARNPVEAQLRTEQEKSFLTYISCVVHKNAASATFDGGTLSLDSGTQGECDLGSGQGRSNGSQDSHGTAAPSPLLSFCRVRVHGGPRASCSCVPGPAAEVTGR